MKDYSFQTHFICGHKSKLKPGPPPDLKLTLEELVSDEEHCFDCNDLQRVIRIIIIDNNTLKKDLGHYDNLEPTRIKRGKRGRLIGEEALRLENDN